MNTSIVKNFDNDIKKVMNFIVLDKRDEARDYFNKIIFKKYEKDIRNKENSLIFFEISFSELDDYLNNKGAAILNNTNKDNVVGSYNSDYREDLKLALEMEQRKNKKSRT